MTAEQGGLAETTGMADRLLFCGDLILSTMESQPEGVSDIGFCALQQSYGNTQNYSAPPHVYWTGRWSAGGRTSGMVVI